jgi:RHS repeat-associated protein
MFPTRNNPGRSSYYADTARQRYQNAPASQSGPLGDPSTDPKARVTSTAQWHDALGRQIATAAYGTNGGTALVRPDTIPQRSDTVLVTTIGYNEAGEAFQTTDPAGRQDRQFCDAAGRTIKTIQNYVDGIVDIDHPDEDVTVEMTYGPDGQVVTLLAKNPVTGDQVTHFVYGTTLAVSDIARSDLLRAEIYPDSDDTTDLLGDGPDGVYDRIEHRYNRQGERIETKDQNETVRAFDYDKLGRRVHDRVTTLGSGVDGAVRRISTTYEIRGMAETITSWDNATVGSGSVVNEVQFVYDDFGQITHDYQAHGGTVNTSTTPKVQYGYASGSANTIRPTTITYPDGRVISYDYGTADSMNDALSRIASIIDDVSSTHLVEYSYLGPYTFVEVDYTEAHIKYTLVGTSGGSDPDTGDIYRGLDRFGRIKDSYWYDYGSSTDVDRIKYGYDRNGSRLWRENTVAASYGKNFDERYAYDLIDRLKAIDRGDLNANKDAVSNLQFAQDWSLDATGNWRTFREDDDGDATWDLNQQRTANQVNEITAITETAGPSWVTPTYNRAGNMTTIPKPADPTQSFTATYDAWNRLVKIEESGNTVAQYEYDGAKRRCVKKTYASGQLDETRHFFYTEPSRWQVIEERVGSSITPDRQFVWGLRYIDDILLRDRDTTGDGAFDERLYGTQDANWNVSSIASAGGVVQERYGYHPYGTPIVLTDAFAFGASSNFDWETMFAGYRWDRAVMLFHVRNRVYIIAMGWGQRDVLRYADSVNLYEYLSGAPLNRTDPTGEVGPIGQCLIGAGIGGAIGALLSLFSSHVNRETACQTRCKVLVNGLSGVIAGCLGAGLANPCLATTIANFAASLASTMCDAYCGCPQNATAVICSLAASLVTSALSCLGIVQAAPYPFPSPLDEIYDALVGALASIAGGTVGTAGAGLCSFWSGF